MVRQLAVILSAFALVWYALNIPAEQVRREANSSPGRINVRDGVARQLIGGFPWKYCEFSYSSSAGGNARRKEYRFRSDKIWYWNIGVGFLVAGALTVFIIAGERRRKKREDGKPPGAMRISLAGMLCLVTLFAGTFGVYRIGIQRLTDDLAAFNHDGGRAVARQHVPKWLAAIIDPSFVMQVDTATVNLAACSDEQFQRIAGLHSLTNINIRGASSDNACTLANLPKVRSLSIGACTLTDEMLEAIGNNPEITHLSLTELEAPLTEAQVSTLHAIISASNHPWHLTMPVFAKTDLRIENLPQLKTLSLVLSTSTDLRRDGAESKTERLEVLNNQTVLEPDMLKELLRQQAESGTAGRSFQYRASGSPELIDEDLLPSVTLANLPAIPYMNFDFPLRSLTIRNAAKLSRLDLQVVHEELILENLPELQAVSFRQPKAPTKLSLKDLPSICVSPTDKFGGGIEFGGLVTKTMVDQLGEYAVALTGYRFSANQLPAQMTLEAFATLLPKTNVDRLSFDQMRFHPTLETDADFSTLPNLDGIESLRIPNHAWGRFGLAAIPNAARAAIERSAAASRPEQKLLYQLLDKLPNLRELQVSRDFTDEHAHYLKSLKKLEILILSESSLTNEGWEQLPEQPNLRALGVPNNVTRLQLRDMPKLEWLQLPHKKLESLELENLPALGTKLHVHAESQLDQVSIKNVREVDLELERMPKDFEVSDTSLTYVIANGEWLTDENFRQLISPETKKLDISNSLVTSQSIDRLVGMKKLQFLDVSYTQLNEEDIKRLLNETTLKTLRAALVDLSDETFAALPEGNVPELAPGFRWGYGVPTLDDDETR